MIQVLIKLDTDNHITEIGSSIFIQDTSEYTVIDEAESGDKYAHAQSQYLPKPLYDDNGRFNFKYIDGKVVTIADEDKPTPEAPKAEPTEQEKINAQLILQIASLKAQMNEVK